MSAAHLWGPRWRHTASEQSSDLAEATVGSESRRPGSLTSCRGCGNRSMPVCCIRKKRKQTSLCSHFRGNGESWSGSLSLPHIYVFNPLPQSTAPTLSCSCVSSTQQKTHFMLIRRYKSFQFDGPVQSSQMHCYALENTALN